jgi:DNA-binding transcriptional LysR family regulator
MDELVGMRLFVRVVQCGSFSAAARQIGSSPASVFRAINSLEDRLGTRLLNRTTRKLSLTEAGEIFSGRVEHILSEIQDVTSELTQLQHAPRGLLRVHARVSLGSQHIAPILPAFLAQYSELRIDLRLSDRAVDIVEDNIDVAICVGRIDSVSLTIRKLTSSPRRVCASPDYLARHGRPVEPGDLIRHNCLTFRAEANQMIWRFLQAKQLTEIRVAGSLQADNAEVLRQAALKGLGVVLLPEWCVGGDLATGRLQLLLADYEATPFGFDNGIYMVTQKARHRSMKVRLFMDFMASNFRNRENWDM